MVYATNNYKGSRALHSTCKYCGIEIEWQVLNRKNRAYELNGKYHWCKNYGGNLKVIKMSPEEMEREYGKAERPKGFRN